MADIISEQTLQFLMLFFNQHQRRDHVITRCFLGIDSFKMPANTRAGTLYLPE